MSRVRRRDTFIVFEIPPIISLGRKHLYRNAKLCSDDTLSGATVVECDRQHVTVCLTTKLCNPEDGYFCQ